MPGVARKNKYRLNMGSVMLATLARRIFCKVIMGKNTSKPWRSKFSSARASERGFA